MAKISEYLKDGNGKPSSKRLMAMQLLWFFMIFNLIIFPMLIYIKAELSVMMFVGSFDFMVLIGVFTPTQLSKIQEVKQTIELGKNNQ